MKSLLLFLLILILEKNTSFAQAIDSTSRKEPWQVHGEVSGFIYPDDFYLNPIVWVKKGHLHAEVRYNYEDLGTGSVFGGYNFSVGDKLHLDATPMLGVAFGNTNAILPAAEFELMYWNVGLYGEIEYAFDLNDSNDDFLSYWGELYYSPADWIWFGIAAQRIRLHETGLDVQRGFLLALQKKWFTVTGYYFNPFSKEYFLTLTLGVTF